MRRRSAITQGRPSSMSIVKFLRPPPVRKVLLASSTRSPTSTGSGVTGNVPVSMRATSSSSLIRPRIRSVWDLMMRMNCTTSAESRALNDSSRVSADPLMEVRGARSSWLTIPRNSARSLSSSFRDVMSCRVTTTVSNSLSSSERDGVALTRTVIDRPSGTLRTISSARTVSPALSAWAMDRSSMDISLPSARRSVRFSRNPCGDWSGFHTLPRILLVSRLKEIGAPVRAWKTATPTGEVSISASRRALACRSSRYRRALAMTSAAWEANSTSVSSSSRVNVGSPSSLTR